MENWFVDIVDTSMRLKKELRISCCLVIWCKRDDGESESGGERGGKKREEGRRDGGKRKRKRRREEGRCKTRRGRRRRDGERKSMHDAPAEIKDMRCDLVQARSFYRAVRGTWQAAHSSCDEGASKHSHQRSRKGKLKEAFFMTYEKSTIKHMFLHVPKGQKSSRFHQASCHNSLTPSLEKEDKTIFA
jgi:hypothetical protein